MGLFYTYNKYIQNKYGSRGYRISVDGGFSCPNRSEDRKTGGCSFCDESGSRPAGIESKQALKEQIDQGLRIATKKYKASHFFLYFQSYTSTFAPVDQLSKLYRETLDLGSFSELIVSTRPDCLPESTIQLLKTLKQEYKIDVWVELGLQTIHDDTLTRINRGHTFRQFIETYNRLKNAGINCTIHLILGLPGEDEIKIQKTLLKISELNPEGIKFHNLHIPEKSPLYQEYILGELPVISNSRYLSLVAWGLEHLSPETVIMRIATDTPASRSGKYPGVKWAKQNYYLELERILKERGTYQGIYYDKSSDKIC